MKIKISETERIISKKRNWIFETRVEKGWTGQYFYPDIKSCYLDLLEYFTRVSKKEILKDAFEESVIKLEEIKKAI